MSRRSQGDSSQQLARFVALVQKTMEAWNVPGLAIALLQNDAVTFCGGFGRCSVGGIQEVNAQTLFPLGSCTKTFTTALMGILVDRGQLDWDTPVKTYLPDLELYDPLVTTKITPRDLVSHCTGLPRHDLFWYHSSLNSQEMLERLRWLELVQSSPSTFQYSNLSYLIAGQLIAQITGKSWEANVQQLLFAPLSMTSSSWSILTAQETDNCAKPCKEVEHTVREIPYYTHWTGIAAAGALVSNVEDMSKWVAFQLQKGYSQHEHILSATQIAQMHTPQIPVSVPSPYLDLSTASYGLGWMIRKYRGDTLVQHGGTIDGFSSMVTLLPQANAGFVLLSNLEDTPLIDALGISLCDLLLNLPEIPWNAQLLTERKTREEHMQRLREKEKPIFNPVPRTFPLTAYTGLFRHPGYGNLSIIEEKQQLSMIFHEVAFPLLHCSRNLFEVDLFGKKMQVSFFMNNDGSISSLALPLEPKVRNILFQRVAS